MSQPNSLLGEHAEDAFNAGSCINAGLDDGVFENGEFSLDELRGAYHSIQNAISHLEDALAKIPDPQTVQCLLHQRLTLQGWRDESLASKGAEQ